jgi:hypothetical protein
LSLNRSPTTSLTSPSRERKSLVHVSVSGSECGAALNLSMISRDQTFGFNHRPVRRISALDITRSNPLGSFLHPCNQLHTPYCSRASNLYRPSPSRTPFFTPWFHVDVRALFCPSIHENTIRLDRVVHTACSWSIVRPRSAWSSTVSFRGSLLYLLILHRIVAVPYSILIHRRPITIHKMSGFADRAKKVLPPSPTHLLISHSMDWLSTITTRFSVTLPPIRTSSRSVISTLVESVPSSVRPTRIDPVTVEFPSTIKPAPMSPLLSDPSLDAICPIGANTFVFSQFSHPRFPHCFRHLLFRDCPTRYPALHCNLTLC